MKKKEIILLLIFIVAAFIAVALTEAFGTGNGIKKQSGLKETEAKKDIHTNK